MCHHFEIRQNVCHIGIINPKINFFFTLGALELAAKVNGLSPDPIFLKYMSPFYNLSKHVSPDIIIPYK